MSQDPLGPKAPAIKVRYSSNNSRGRPLVASGNNLETAQSARSFHVKAAVAQQVHRYNEGQPASRITPRQAIRVAVNEKPTLKRTSTFKFRRIPSALIKFMTKNSDRPAKTAVFVCHFIASTQKTRCLYGVRWSLRSWCSSPSTYWFQCQRVFGIQGIAARLHKCVFGTLCACPPLLSPVSDNVVASGCHADTESGRDVPATMTYGTLLQSPLQGSEDGQVLCFNLRYKDGGWTGPCTLLYVIE